MAFGLLSLASCAALRPRAGTSRTIDANEGDRAAALAPRPAPVATGSIVHVATGTYRTCVLRSSGEAACWGAPFVRSSPLAGFHEDAESRRSLAAARPVLGLTDGARLFLSSTHACAITRGRRVACWGANESGQLGPDGGAGRENAATVSGLERVVDLALGDSHTCAMIEGGEIRCWGSNESGQLGTGSTAPFVATPTRVPLEAPAATVAAGAAHSCASDARGRLFCWGAGDAGQIGAPVADAVRRPREFVGLPRSAGLASIHAGGRGSCARMLDGSVHCWGARWVGDPHRGSPYDPDPTPSDPGLSSASVALVMGGERACSVDRAGAVWCFSRLDRDQHWMYRSPMEQPAVAAPAALAVSSTHVCALSASSELRCWGTNDRGQLGLAGAHDGRRPVTARGLADAVAVGVGEGFSCALQSSGRVSCWGRVSTAEGGVWSSAVPSETPGISTARELVVARWHACARRESGEVLCWGDNQRGQLGRAGIGGSLTPVEAVGLRGAIAISAAAIQSCALTAGGAVRCTHTAGDPSALEPRGATSIRAIRGGWGGTYALRSDGRVLSWREAVAGREATEVTALGDSVTALFVGVCTACAQRANGERACTFPSGESWICESAVRGAVSQVQGTVAEISPGARHICLRMADGAVLCAGEGEAGQLGDGVYHSTDRFAPVTGLADARALSCGESHCCAARTNGTVACWGSNSRGELGDGLTGGPPPLLLRAPTLVPGL
jgi:alpha-tubulin suppressor-like RCC1 family protein